MKPENLKDVFKELDAQFPEFGMTEKTNAREAAAKKCAEADAPILKKDVAILTDLYERLFFNIATEELFQTCVAMSAQERWNMVEPFTWE